MLVTFNGKSFDWPLLETRYRMSRKISVPTPRAHLDFLHPARNLWRLRLGSVRLSELERHVLGWDRGADVLSGQIPQIYFDYLRGGAAGTARPGAQPQPDGPARPGGTVEPDSFAAQRRREPWDKTAWNCLGSLASAKSEASTREPASFTRSRSRRSCQPKQIGQRGARWHDSPSEKVISIWHVSFGKMHSEIHGTAMRPTSNWRSTTNTRPAIRSKLDKWSIRHSIELRRAIQVGDIAPGAYREFKAKFDRRMERLERKSRRPLLDALRHPNSVANGECDGRRTKTRTWESWPAFWSRVI